MKNVFKVVTVAILVIALTTSLSASSLIRDVSGKENKGIIVTYNNTAQTLKDGNGNVVYPVIINGSTYLPVRAVATMMGADITWDKATSTVSIKTNGEVPADAVPNDLPPTNGGATTKPSPETNASSNSGTFKDPVALGNSFSYNDPLTYIDGDKIDANFTVTISKVEAITREQIAALGFKRPEDSSLVDYVMVTLKYDAKDATYFSGSSAYFYLGQLAPSIWGTKTVEDDYIICGTEFGFAGSLDESRDTATGFTQLFRGDSQSYSAQGKVLMTVYKNVENYLVLQKLDTTNYDASFIYFKLK